MTDCKSFVIENLASQAKSAWNGGQIRESDALSAALVELESRFKCNSADRIAAVRTRYLPRLARIRMEQDALGSSVEDTSAFFVLQREWATLTDVLALLDGKVIS